MNKAEIIKAFDNVIEATKLEKNACKDALDYVIKDTRLNTFIESRNFIQTELSEELPAKKESK